ncbi:MAG: nickel-dependent lactate racemase [Mycobacterium leprae]
MESVLKYGKSTVTLRIPDHNVAGVILPKELPGLADPQAAVAAALAQPTGTPPLLELLKAKRPARIAVVVNDITRPTPYNAMLPPLLATFDAAGIKPEQVLFVVATGIHRGHTDQENREIFGAEVVDRYRFISHDCTGELAQIGRLSDGTDLVINKEVAEADFIITTGMINLHYFAGYSGGRKSILPGIAGKSLIKHNHSYMAHPKAGMGRYKDNPVHHIMLESARMVGVDFILNVVTNFHREVVQVVAGDVEAAWLEGVQTCGSMSVVPLAEQADVAICSPGGYPKDLDVYQTQKAIEGADYAVKPGGTIVVVAECREGLGGEATFEEWMREAKTLDEIIERFNHHFELGGHKAYAMAKTLKQKEVIFVSSLAPETVKLLFCRHAATLEEAMAYVAAKHGPDYKALILPQAAVVLPVVGEQ